MPKWCFHNVTSLNPQDLPLSKKQFQYDPTNKRELCIYQIYQRFAPLKFNRNSAKRADFHFEFKTSGLRLSLCLYLTLF